MLAMNGWGVVMMMAWLSIDFLLASFIPDLWRTSEFIAAAKFVAKFPQVSMDMYPVRLLTLLSKLLFFFFN